MANLPGRHALPGMPASAEAEATPEGGREMDVEVAAARGRENP
jgi:hypothetical protein